MKSSTNMNTLPKDPVVHSFYIGGIDESDMPMLTSVKKVLDKKINAKDCTIDIKKFADYCNRTELIARQYITYIENLVYYERRFVIVNGAKEYEKIDSIRAAAIQARAACTDS